MTSAPSALSRSGLAKPRRLSRVNNVCRVSTPPTVATVVPRPPPRTAPASTTAVMAWNSYPAPASADRPANPASRIPATTAEIPEMTNVAVRMRHTSTPDSIAARSPPPTANTWLPKRVWCNSNVAQATTTTRTGTAHGSWPISGTPVIPDRPSTRRLSASAPVGAAPADPSPARSSAFPPAAEGVQRHRAHDDHAAHEGAQERVGLEEVEDAVEYREDPHRGERPEQPPLPAGERRPAEHDGGDGFQVVPA